jgi:hypothetical protein
MGDVRFAGCVVRKDRLRCSFTLERPERTPGWTVREAVPGWWVHTFDLVTPDALDDRLAALVAESWRRFGMRARLARGPRRPLNRRG